MSESHHLIRTFLLLLATLVGSSAATAQRALLDDRWYRNQTDNFILFSQVSSRQTRRFAAELESWRQVAASIIGGESAFPKANVPNYVYLFDNPQSFQHFIVAEEPAFFYATPRANFMALVSGESESERIALHHYAHFLVKNFSDLRLPRWYEEGLAGYLSQVRVDRGRAEFQEFDSSNNELMEQLSHSLSMERLLYRDEALASPRVIQIANLKSEALLYFLKHGYQEEGFSDRRRQLAQYLALLIEGRNPRFAFDRAFDVTTAQLDDEFHAYLLSGNKPAASIVHEPLREPVISESASMEAGSLAVMLGELGLNSGRAETAQFYFQWAIDAGADMARGYSGLGDALRFQELPNMDQTIARYFEQALAVAPDDPDIVLDYGEYWEAELKDCDKTYPPSQRQRILADVRQHFEQALALAPDNPEAHLALAQVYLFEGQDWRLGVASQRRAFALLPADGFIMEQAIRYAIAADDYEAAERLITEMAEPMHSFGEPEYVTDLRERLLRKRRNEPYDACADD